MRSVVEPVLGIVVTVDVETSDPGPSIADDHCLQILIVHVLLVAIGIVCIILPIPDPHTLGLHFHIGGWKPDSNALLLLEKRTGGSLLCFRLIPRSIFGTLVTIEQPARAACNHYCVAAAEQHQQRDHSYQQHCALPGQVVSRHGLWGRSGLDRFHS